MNERQPSVGRTVSRSKVTENFAGMVAVGGINADFVVVLYWGPQKPGNVVVDDGVVAPAERLVAYGW